MCDSAATQHVPATRPQSTTELWGGLVCVLMAAAAARVRAPVSADELGENIQVVRYEKGQKYGAHRDFFNPNDYHRQVRAHANGSWGHGGGAARGTQRGSGGHSAWQRWLSDVPWQHCQGARRRHAGGAACEGWLLRSLECLHARGASRGHCVTGAHRGRSLCALVVRCSQRCFGASSTVRGIDWLLSSGEASRLSQPPPPPPMHLRRSAYCRECRFFCAERIAGCARGWWGCSGIWRR